MKKQTRYAPEERERAIRIVQQQTASHSSLQGKFVLGLRGRHSSL